jgi:aminodeoxychorismate lyase
MIAFLSGRFIPEEKAVVSIFDRGFLFGDGLFEVMLVRRGTIFRWDDHMGRLRPGIALLQLTVPYSPDDLFRFSMELIRRNRMPDCLLRLNVSRGITARGYSPRNAHNPAVVLTLHPAPVLDARRMSRWRVVTSSFRLPANDPLTRFKTTNKLPQVMARAEADAAGAHDALLLNSTGHLAEGTSCNVFWVSDNVVRTPPLAGGALPGVTRAAILELCVRMNIPSRQSNARPAALLDAQGAFLTNTSAGLVEIESLDGCKLRRSPLVKTLWRAYRALLDEASLEHPTPELMGSAPSRQTVAEQTKSSLIGDPRPLI